MPSMPSQPLAESSPAYRWLIAVPAVAILIAWWPSLGASFQFDDWNVIVNEPRVHSLAAWWHSMPGIRPLLKLTYALNSAPGGSPATFRSFNVLLHATNSMLVYGLLRERGDRAGLPRLQSQFAALLAALVFALHPVQTEAVTYISGRSSSLAAGFCLLSLYCWVRAEGSATARGSSWWMSGCCLAYTAAVASKETAWVLPLALWLYSADRPLRATMRRLMLPSGLAVFIAIAALSLPAYRHLLEISLQTRSPASNVLTQAHALFYLGGQLLRIGHGNADPQLPIVDHADFPGIALCGVWLSVIVLALIHVRRAPIPAFAVLWFMLWLAPTNSVLPRLDVANDRQLYLALMGPAWLLAVGVGILWSRRPSLAYGAAALIVVLLACATLQRNRIYATEIAFWENTVMRNPVSARAHNNLGMAYAFDCRFDEAAMEFERSIEQDPQDYKARINLQLLRQGALPGVDQRQCESKAR